MKFVILSNKRLPGYNVLGPILSPAEYDVHLVLRWLMNNIDVREVMDDGSYRKLTIHDERLNELVQEKTTEKMEERKQCSSEKITEVKPQGNVKLKEQVIKPKKEQPTVQPKKEATKIVEQPKKEKNVVEKPEIFIDELEKPE